MRAFFILLILLWPTLVQASHAHQIYCRSYNDMVAELLKYDETPFAVGIINETIVLEVFTSPEGTFTVVLTKDNLSCATATGKSWELVPRPMEGEAT